MENLHSANICETVDHIPGIFVFPGILVFSEEYLRSCRRENLCFRDFLCFRRNICVFTGGKFAFLQEGNAQLLQQHPDRAQHLRQCPSHLCDHGRFQEQFW